MAGQSWLAIKASCLCLRDGLFQNQKIKKEKNKIKDLFLFRGIVILGAKSKREN